MTIKSSAGKGIDWMEGGADDDLVEGSYGNDTLYGDAGNDDMDGGVEPAFCTAAMAMTRSSATSR